MLYNGKKNCIGEITTTKKVQPEKKKKMPKVCKGKEDTKNKVNKS